MASDIRQLIEKLPKCELHVHLEGTLEPCLARHLAARNELPIPADIGTSDDKGYPFWDLTSFLRVYYASMSCLLTEDDFSDLVIAYLRKAHSQNVLHVEMFFDPQAHTSRGVDFEVILSGLCKGIETVKKECDISTGLIMCFLRDHSAESAAQTLEALLASPLRSRIIGIGLDSDERNNPPVKFASVYAKAKKAGLRTTMHCDVDQTNSIEHIRQALHDIGVERIDHGTNIVEDSLLVEEVRSKGIGLTCCPMSNSVVCTDFKGKEMKQLLEQGVKITINSDDPAYFGGYMTENLALMLRADMGVSQLVRMARNAFEISWISAAERAGFIAKIDEFAALHQIRA